MHVWSGNTNWVRLPAATHLFDKAAMRVCLGFSEGLPLAVALGFEQPQPWCVQDLSGLRDSARFHGAFKSIQLRRPASVTLYVAFNVPHYTCITRR